MKRLMLLFIALILFGCTSQEAQLSYLPESTPAPTALYTPTPPPVPESIPLAPVVGEGFKTDANGLPILDEKQHYYQNYLTVSNLRIYEENGETLIDAVITNDYPRKLSGGLCIRFKEGDLMYGYAEFYTAGGGLVLFPGENRVYADVLTEVDVQMMDFEIAVSTALVPEQ